MNDSIISRRNFLFGTGVCSVGLLSGCADRATFETEPSQFSPSEVEDSPYSISNKREINLRSLISRIIDRSVPVNATSYFVRYDHDTLPQFAFNLSSPSLSVFDRELNPLGKEDTDQLFELLFTVANREDTGITLEEYELIDEQLFETSLGRETLETYEVVAESTQFGQILYDCYLLTHNIDSSLIATAGFVIKDIEAFEVDYSSGYEEQREIMVQLLSSVDFPVNWEDITVSQ